MKKYEAPEFDVTAYEVEDIITVSVVTDGFHDGGNAGENGWVDITW